MDTLPGGAVRVTNTAEGMWAVEEIWRLTPELRIGSAGEDSATTFASVSALEVGDDGRIYVLDRQLNELRIFDAAGQLMKRTGRSGEGPGEFKSANGLQWVGDSLLVIDGSGGRYTLYDRDGMMSRTMQRPVGSYGWAYQGGFVNGLLYESGFSRNGNEYRGALIGVQLNEQAELRDTVPIPIMDVPTIEIYSVRNERGGMNMSVPFAPEHMWWLGGDGAIWYAHGGEYRILHGTFDGDTLREIVGVHSPAPVSQAEIDEWAAGESARDFKARGGDLDLGRIPKHKPVIRDLFRDPDGNLWVELHPVDNESTFDLFDPEGRFLGRVATNERRGRWADPIVKNGKLYMVTLDDLDVPYVSVFRIER